MPSRLRERWESFTKEQRLSVVLLCICGFFALGLSAYQMNMNVHGPFLADKAQAIAFKQSLLPSPDEQDAKQKRTDTDGDGLSDWDEIQVYHLNPNLKDTCGDGILDNIRVATGKNLVCTSGSGNSSGNIDTAQIYSSTSSLTALKQTAQATDSVMSGAIQAANTVNAQDVAAQHASSSAAVQGSVSSTGSYIARDPQAIRSALQGRIDAETLNAIPDDRLLLYYDQALAEQNGTTSTAPSNPSSSTGTSL